MMALWLALLFGAVPANAGDIPARSPLGIDYMALTEGDAQLAELLLAGEAEWMGNAAEKYKSPEFWEATCNQIISEQILKRALDRLLNYTPNMVSSFIELPKEQYPLLHAIGALTEAQKDYAEAQKDHAEAEKDYAEAQKDYAAAEKMLEQAQAIAKAFGGKN